MAEAGLSAAPTAQLPGTLGSLRPPWLNVLLFVLTGLSAFAAGAVLSDTALPPRLADKALTDAVGSLAVFADEVALRNGLGFSLALLAILLSHEMGHFVLARRHGVDASWPFFIPAPLLSIIGTLGAVIRLRSLPRTRRALIDIGAAGPLAGFAVTVPVLVLGLRWSTLVAAEPESARWSLAESLASFVQGGHFLPVRDAFDLGAPLGMSLLQRLVVGPIPAGQSLALHPVAVAGWFGMLLTALNLLPLGQLDGGHCLFAISPRLHRALGAPLSALLFALGIFTAFPGWAIWGLLMGLWLSHHPPVTDAEPALDGTRKLVLAAALVVFALSFSPVPLATLRG